MSDWEIRFYVLVAVLIKLYQLFKEGKFKSFKA